MLQRQPVIAFTVDVLQHQPHRTPVDVQLHTPVLTGYLRPHRVSDTFSCYFAPTETAPIRVGQIHWEENQYAFGLALVAVATEETGHHEEAEELLRYIRIVREAFDQDQDA